MKRNITIITVALLISIPYPVIGKESSPLSVSQIIKFLSSTKITIRGMHDTLGGEQSSGFDIITKLSGQQPKLWSGDFGFSTHPNDSIRLRRKLLTKVRELQGQGVLIMLSWHQCNPVTGEPCTFKDGVQKSLNEKQWNDILLDDTDLNRRWKRHVDVLAFYLKEFQKNGIPILLRPYHEANIPGFWWANSIADRSKQLWRQLHYYYTNFHALKNIIWVWSVSYHPKYWNIMAEYYPGDNVVDVIGLDIYPPTKIGEPKFEHAWQSLKGITNNKPIGLSEVSRLPSRNELNMRNWAFVVPWGINMLKRDNTVKEIYDLYSQ